MWTAFRNLRAQFVSHHCKWTFVCKFSVELPVAKWSLQLFFRGSRFHFICGTRKSEFAGRVLWCNIGHFFACLLQTKSFVTPFQIVLFFFTKDRVWAISLIWESEENYWAAEKCNVFFRYNHFKTSIVLFLFCILYQFYQVVCGFNTFCLQNLCISEFLAHRLAAGQPFTANFI